jgi:kynureninase
MTQREVAAMAKEQQSTDALLRWRAEFPILENTTYMISHSLGPMPRRAERALKEFTDTWATRGIRAWNEGWWDMPLTCGDLIGSIIGASKGRVAMHQNVSIAQTIVCSCFDWSGARKRLVTDGLNFPSNDYIYHGLARQGAEIVSVPSADGMTIPLERILEAIDERTLLVSISHVAFRSSYLHDLKTITERAHAVGAYIVADLYQSAGIVPLDVAALQVDFAVGGSVKWLLGGPGAGYLYVRPDLDATLRPAATGWAAHAHPFEFENGPIQYANDMHRFLNGTPNVPAMYSARSGYEIVNEIGVDVIRAKSKRQTQRMIELADAAGLAVHSPRDPELRGGTVIFNVPEGRRVTDELIRRQILVDYRPGAGVRVAPHFYTTDAEIEETVGEMQSIVRENQGAVD